MNSIYLFIKLCIYCYINKYIHRAHIHGMIVIKLIYQLLLCSVFDSHRVSYSSGCVLSHTLTSVIFFLNMIYWSGTGKYKSRERRISICIYDFWIHNMNIQEKGERENIHSLVNEWISNNHVNFENINHC